MTKDERMLLIRWLDEHIGALRYCLRESGSYAAVPMDKTDLEMLEALRALLAPAAEATAEIGKKPAKPLLCGALKAFADKQGCEALTEALIGFCELRKAKKKPLTQRAMGMIVKKLETMSGDPKIQAEIVNRCVEMGWTGIYYTSPASYQVDKPKESGEYSSFDTDEFFEAALQRTFELHERIKNEG